MVLLEKFSCAFPHIVFLLGNADLTASNSCPLTCATWSMSFHSVSLWFLKSGAPDELSKWDTVDEPFWDDWPGSLGELEVSFTHRKFINLLQLKIWDIYKIVNSSADFSAPFVFCSPCKILPFLFKTCMEDFPPCIFSNQLFTLKSICCAFSCHQPGGVPNANQYRKW